MSSARDVKGYGSGEWGRTLRKTGGREGRGSEGAGRVA